jgi:hypothetical protein
MGRTCKVFTAVTLFAALAIPVHVAAQDEQDHNNHHKHHRYQLIDMGTFGGSQSAIYFPVDDNDKSVNKGGVTVSFPRLPLPSSRIAIR